MATCRYEEALAVTEIILEHSPRNAFAMANQGQACFHLLGRFLEEYGSVFLIPPLLRVRYARLLRRNHEAFAAAMALGWEPVEPDL